MTVGWVGQLTIPPTMIDGGGARVIGRSATESLILLQKDLEPDTLVGALARPLLTIGEWERVRPAVEKMAQHIHLELLVVDKAGPSVGFMVQADTFKTWKRPWRQKQIQSASFAGRHSTEMLKKTQCEDETVLADGINPSMGKPLTHYILPFGKKKAVQAVAVSFLEAGSHRRAG